MGRVYDRLRSLQGEINHHNAPMPSPEEADRLFVAEVQKYFHLTFFGVPFDEPYAQLLALLTDQEVATHIASLTFTGPDEGANGTRNWDLTPLVESLVTFPYLTAFTIERTRPEDHNITIVARTYEENGSIAKLITKAPRLKSLVIPSAPDAAFFERDQHPLTFLGVDVGYNAQDFLLNFSQSTCFPQLQVLEYGDFSDRSLADPSLFRTPFEHYLTLFRSSAFKPIRRFVLRNPTCTMEDIKVLKALRPDMLFRVVRSYGEYVQ
jgi:hypothetical protein